MTQVNMQHIQQFQSEYHELITQFLNRSDINNLTQKQVALFMDEVKYFWLARLDIIDVELEAVTEHNSCFLLSGAVYLNVSDNEHFYFKSFGDFHLLSDPFLKMENFFRLPDGSVGTDEVIDYFRRVLFDTISILEKYRGDFFIIPVRLLAIESDENHHDLLDKFFLTFLSSIFGKQYRDRDSFCKDYGTFEEIENQLEPYVRQKLIFNNHIEEGISLREKIEIHNESQSSYIQLMAGQSDAQVFLVILYSYLAQISDILLVCSSLRLNPYIRYEVTFHYLLLVMYTFLDDKNLRDMIEKAIIFYIFRRAMDGVFEQYESFKDYCVRINEKRALPRIIKYMREHEIDIFHSGVQELRVIIEKMFADIIEHPQENNQ